MFLLLLFLIKEEFISSLPPARGWGAAIEVNGAEEYKKISLRRIIKVTSWNINRRVTCKKCNITIFTRTVERGKAIKFNIKIFYSLDNLVNKHCIGTTFFPRCWGARGRGRRGRGPGPGQSRSALPLPRREQRIRGGDAPRRGAGAAPAPDSALMNFMSLAKRGKWFVSSKPANRKHGFVSFVTST